jgi:NAD(P)-dependent dehydrogenase (short-subunit alcohol dehydrogenase family)
MSELQLGGRRCVVAGEDTPLRAALCEGLERAGAVVAPVAVATTRDAAEQAVADVRQALDGRAGALVTTPPPLVAASLDELDPVTFDGAIAAAYKSPFVYTQALLGDLRAGGDGRIVHVTSAAGILGRAYTSHLAAGARATIALMRTVAYEEGPAVKANAIATGPMDGDALLGARARALVEQTDTRPEDAVAAVAERIPLARLTTTDDVLQTLLWALAPQSSFLTGEVLTVAGASELQVWP